MFRFDREGKQVPSGCGAALAATAPRCTRVGGFCDRHTVPVACHAPATEVHKGNGGDTWPTHRIDPPRPPWMP